MAYYLAQVSVGVNRIGMYGYDGFIHARGYRIVTGDKRGRKVWDIGPITAKAFDDV